MKLLIIPSSDTTSLNIIVRCVSIAVRAAKLGHLVGILAPSALVERFKSLPASFFEYPVPPTIHRVHLDAPPIKKYGDYAALIGLNDPNFIQECLEIEQRIIETFDPDVIYSDLNLTASISARICGRPLASLCNLAWTPPYLLDDAFEFDTRQTAPFNSVLDHAGLPRIRDLSDLIFLFSEHKIVPSCPEFERFHPSIEGIEYCGYLYSPEVESSIEALPVDKRFKNVLVYMGIGDVDLQMMSSVLPAAFDGSHYKVTVVVGDFYSDVPGPTSNVNYVRFLPLREALGGTDLAIFHGGSGLVMTCLLEGVPGLMFPCGVYEREFHAETMAKVGAGVVLYERDDFTVQNLRQYSQSILEGNYAANAKRFGDYLRTLGGPDRAVQLLSQIATPSPVVPVGS